MGVVKAIGATRPLWRKRTRLAIGYTHPMTSHCPQCGRVLLLGNTVCPGCERQGIAATWGFWPVALGVLALVPTALVVSYLVLAIPLSVGTVIGTGLLALTQLALVWLLAIRAWPPSLAAIGLGPSRIPRGRALTAGVIALAANLGFTQLYAMATMAMGWELLTPPNLPSGLLLPGGWAVISVIALAVATPIAEEIFFRGFVLRGLSGSWGFVPALVVSSALFAALHSHPGIIIPVFVTALLLGGLYRYTGSVRPCIAVHAAQNLLAMATVPLGP